MKTAKWIWTGGWTAALMLAASACATAAGRDDGRVGCRVELDRGVLPSGSTQKAVIKVTIDAPRPPARNERPPVNLTIVLDRSGSMQGDKLERAKEGAIEALRRLSPQDRFSLVVYDDQIETVVPAQSAANIEWVEGRIRQIRAGNSTALFGGVSQGAAELRKNTEGRYVNRLILLSDGLANVGPSQPADLARLGVALNKEQIAVTTVGVGSDYNEDLMTQLSQSSGGNAYFVRESAELPKIFAAELGDVLSVVARRVVLEIVCPEGVRPLRLIGRDGRIRGNKIEVELSQLCGGQQKYALIEVEVAPGRPHEDRPVAVAQCSYENVLRQCPEQSEARVSARFSEREEEVAQSVNKPVQVETLRNIVAETRDQAIQMVDQGRKEEAVKLIAANGYLVSQEAGKYGLKKDMERELTVLNNDATVIVDNAGLPAANRKAMRTESYQMRNQQLEGQSISEDMMRTPKK